MLPCFMLPLFIPSIPIMAGAREFSYTYIIILFVIGRQTGRNFKERGQLGTISIQFIYLCIKGPCKVSALPKEPIAVEIITPSPHKLANGTGS